MTGVLYLLYANSWVEFLKVSSHFKGDDAVIRNHQKDWDVHHCDQLAIVGIRWRENVKCADSRFHPGLGYKSDYLGSPKWVPVSSLNQCLVHVETEIAAVLFDYIALIHLPLALDVQERGVREYETADCCVNLTRHNCRCHSSHRMAEEHGRGKFKPLHKSHDVGGIVLVAISMGRGARIPMAPCVGHQDVILSFERACQGAPTRAVSHQSME